MDKTMAKQAGEVKNQKKKKKKKKKNQTQKKNIIWNWAIHLQTKEKTTNRVTY